MIDKNNAAKAAAEAAIAPKAAVQPGNGKVVDPGHDLNGNKVHSIGIWGTSYAAMMAIPYTAWGHPLAQRLGIPAQLKFDAKVEAGEASPIGKESFAINAALLTLQHR